MDTDAPPEGPTEEKPEAATQKQKPNQKAKKKKVKDQYEVVLKGLALTYALEMATQVEMAVTLEECLTW